MAIASFFLYSSHVNIALTILLSILATEVFSMGADSTRIQPHAANAHYWQYQNQPVVLLGGTEADNCFQIPNLEAHLDLLVSVGGNYVRNTMSDRPDHGYEVKAFGQNGDGLYDLDTWNDAYWQKFSDMLRWTAERKIFVQIELWDRFDHSRENWDVDPFNPKNNVNYSHEESSLAAAYPEHPRSQPAALLLHRARAAKQRERARIPARLYRQSALLRPRLRPRALLHRQRDQRRPGLG